MSHPFLPDKKLFNPKFEGYKFDYTIDQDEYVNRYPLPSSPSTHTASHTSTESSIGWYNENQTQSRTTQHQNHLTVGGGEDEAIYIDEEYNVIGISVDSETITPSFRTVFELARPISSSSVPWNSEFPSAAYLSSHLGSSLSPNITSNPSIPSSSGLPLAPDSKLSPLLFVSDGLGCMYVLRPAPKESYELVELEQLIVPSEDAGKEGDDEAKLEAHEGDGGMGVGTAQPFLIHSVDQVSADTAVAILSSRYRHRSPQPIPIPKSGQEGGSRTKDKDRKAISSHVDSISIWAVKFDLPSITQTLVPKQPRPMTILFHLLGTSPHPMYPGSPPILTSYDPERKAWMILGECSYHPVPTSSNTCNITSTATGAAYDYEPTPDEIAPIPRAGENLDNLPLPLTAQVQTASSRPPQYSWTQTTDSVTIAFAIPSETAKEEINVKFGVNSLSLSIEPSAGLSSGIETAVPLPRYTLNTFWDTISPSTSYWTWERDSEPSPSFKAESSLMSTSSKGDSRAKFGLLTLHLDKQHEGTRWMSVFASQGHMDREEEVPETLDPLELVGIRESLEKYTSSLHSASATPTVGGPGLGASSSSSRSGPNSSLGSNSGLGGLDLNGLDGLGGGGVPSLSKGEIDDQVDSNVGRLTCASWIGLGPTLTTSSGTVRLLSTPLPGSGSGRSTDISVVIKDGVDGPVYVLQPPPSPSPSPDTNTKSNIQSKWLHKSTFSALAFVLASKRDVRYTFHTDDLEAVYALESGRRGGGGGNMYVYRQVEKGGDGKWAKQAILKIDDGRGGALVGVGGVHQDGAKLILALTERQLVIVRTW